MNGTEFWRLPGLKNHSTTVWPTEMVSCMKFAVFLMSCLLLFFLAGAFPIDDANSQLIVFKTPAFILLAGALAASLLNCCWKRRRMRSARGIGFQLTHLGMVLIMAGAFIGFVRGQRERFSIPLVKHAALNRFRGEGGKIVEFDFKITASDFVVDFYPPQYALYRAPQAEGADFEFVDKFPVPENSDVMELKEGGQVALEELRQDGTDWKPFLHLPNGYALQRLQHTPKHFEALLHLTDESGEELERKVMVNHPVDFKGWRFYLSSYDQQQRLYIVLSARRDPGRGAVIAGLWAVIIGVTLICFAKAEEARK